MTNNKIVSTFFRVLLSQFSELTAKEKVVLYLRYLRDDKSLSFTKIGKILSLSPERIRQIEFTAIKKIRWLLFFEKSKNQKKYKQILEIFDLVEIT